MKNLVRTICAGALIGTLALTGCADKKKPTREQFKTDIITTLPAIGKVTLKDIDNDGLVDAIEQNEGNIVKYVARGYETKVRGHVYLNDVYTRIMPANMRMVASEVLRSQQELSFQVANDYYSKKSD